MGRGLIVGAGAGLLRDVIIDLHTRQDIGPDAKRLLEPDRHVGGQLRMAIEEIAVCLACHVETGCEAVDAHAVGVDDLALQPVAGVNRERGVHDQGHRL